MFKMVGLIFRNVLRNRRRTLLTLISTIISMAVLTLMMGLYYGVFLETSSTPTAAKRIITRHKVSLVQPLPANYLQKIRAVDGVEAATTSTWFQGVYKEPKNFFPRFAADPDTILQVQAEYILPDDQLEAFKRTRTGAIASEAVAKKFNWEIGQKIPIKGDIYLVDLELTLVGIFQTPTDPASEVLYFDREYLAQLLKGSGDAEAERIGTVTAIVKDQNDVPRISKAIDEMFANSTAPTRTESEKEFLRGFVSLIGNVRLVLITLGGAVTFTILLVSANTIAMAVRERTREIAIIRTLGYTPGEIAWLVIGESALLSMIGGGLGVAFGAMMSSAVTPFLRGFGYRGVSWEPMAAAVALAIFIGIAASVIPAIIASRRDLVPSLRFAG